MAMANANAAAFSFVEMLAQDLKDERLELPAFPDAVLRIQQVLQDENSNADAVVRVVSTDPALAARLLRMANSVQFRRGETEITDLRNAISRMGFTLVRSVSVSFAMRALRRQDRFEDIKIRLEGIWQESLEIAAVCFVLAKRFTKLNPDQAMLAGLLHVLGKLYILMRAKDVDGVDEAVMAEVVSHWHASIAKAILESWGLPEALQIAVEHQDDLQLELDGPVTLMDVLIAAKLLSRPGQEPPDPEHYPALKRVGLAAADRVLEVMGDYNDEIQNVRSSLSE